MWRHGLVGVWKIHLRGRIDDGKSPTRLLIGYVTADRAGERRWRRIGSRLQEAAFKWTRRRRACCRVFDGFGRGVGQALPNNADGMTDRRPASVVPPPAAKFNENLSK